MVGGGHGILHAVHTLRLKRGVPRKSNRYRYLGLFGDVVAAHLVNLVVLAKAKVVLSFRCRFAISPPLLLQPANEITTLDYIFQSTP